MLAKRTPLQTNGERRGVRGGKRIDGKYRGEGRRKVERARLVQGTHDMWTTERGWYSSYPTSGSLLRRNEHDNPGQAEPRLWEKFRWKMRRCAWPRGGSAAARAFRLLSGNPSPFQCFPRWGCERASWVQGRCRTRRPWTSLAAIFLLRVSAHQSFISHLPISFRRYQFSIIFFIPYSTMALLLYLYLREREGKMICKCLIWKLKKSLCRWKD